MVGVAPGDFDFNTSSFSNCGWYYYLKSSMLWSGPPHCYSNKETNLKKVKDEIVLVMDMNKKTLKFVIDDEDKGDSYIDIPIDKKLYPTVFLCDVDDSVEIVEC